ncbi:DUF2884 family protein [Chromatiaceae bacterium AAb-1]|nr:DUF2884 family protein [Chromatiaceae bacterium AAb-1]
MKNLLAAFFCFVTLSAIADHNCQFNLQHDLQITPQHITLKNKAQELWRITPTGELWLHGSAVTTSPATHQLLQTYQQGIREQARETVTIVADALELATSAVDQVLTELTGLSLEKHPSMQQALLRMRESTGQLVIEDGDTLLINGSRFNQLDQAFDKQFEQAIEQAVTNSIGNVMILAGKALLNGDGSLEQRIDAFSKRMERFGEDLEQRISAQSHDLELRAEQLCGQLQQLDQLEASIIQQIPAMPRLIKTGRTATSGWLLR